MNFWHHLPRPFFASAPLKDVTDPAFRTLLVKYGKPDVVWTEFVSADGLYHTREIGKMSDKENPLMRDLLFTPEQRPIVAQIFSSKPEMITYATKLVAAQGFDGVDINMGCPDRSVEKQGSGAALIKTPALARALIRAAKEASSLPVSIKTRVGYHKESLEEWLPALLEEDPAAITLHLRTRKEMSLVPAHWELMKEAVKIRDEVNPRVLLIGNGDLTDLADARVRVAESGCDGAMIGRGMFGNPWVFNVGSPRPNISERLAALIELAHGFEQLSPPKNFAILKKHIKAFITDFPGAAELRAKLMDTASAAELENILNSCEIV